MKINNISQKSFSIQHSTPVKFKSGLGFNYDYDPKDDTVKVPRKKFLQDKFFGTLLTCWVAYDLIKLAINWFDSRPPKL